MNENYVEIFMEPLYECLNYNPKFGHSAKEEGYTLDEFLQLYGEDPFYSWIGLDSPYMFAAHKAAGCMTSIYRQIGIGCERLFRQIIFDCTGYEDYSSTQWSYKSKTQAGKEKILTLDGRLEIDDIRDKDVKKRAKKWIADSCKQLGIDNKGFKGAVFEVRQGYKSKDSKRQNGDIDFAFCKDVLGFDLAEFFKTNSPFIREKTGKVLEQLFSIHEAKK